MSRIDVLKKAYNDKCVCQGEWLECAKEILHNNGLIKIFLLMPLLVASHGPRKGS